MKPDTERLKPLRGLPPPTTMKAPQHAIGLFVYYVKWIPRFSDTVSKLKAVKFSVGLADFEYLKNSIAKASLQAINESQPFVME